MRVECHQFRHVNLPQALDRASKEESGELMRHLIPQATPARVLTTLT